MKNLIGALQMTSIVPRCGLGFIAIIAVLFASVSVAEETNQDMAGELHVRGEARIMVAPDQVSVVLGVTTESSSAKKAIKANNAKMNEVVRVLQLLGLSDSEYSTRQFRVQPQWSSRPKGADNSWSSKIIAYRVDNNLHVSTQQLDLLGELIAATTEAGANQVNSIHFSLANPRQYRTQVIAKAMANAKADAMTLADASGEAIQRTLSIRLDNAATSVTRADVGMMKSRMMMADSMAESAPPIDAGDIAVSASVSVVYELARKNDG